MLSKVELRKSESGFTMVEVVVSTAIFVIVMGSIYGLLRVARNGRLNTTQRTELIQNVRVALNALGRDAINAGVSVSRGEFIMRTDEHCMFAKDFDKTITDVCQNNWIMTARRYFLDPVKWQVMDLPYIDYEKLCIQTAKDTRKFTGMPWKERQEERKDIAIDETMAMQGSVWVMKRSWWDKVIGELQTEGYGPMYQDSHEMVFKTRKAGGKLMINKNTWFAHRHVSFQRTHAYGNTDFYPNLKYAHDLWRPYYEEIKKLWKI